MFSRQEIARQKQAFWTAFGKYMKPVPSANGEKINWINYKTGVTGIYFRMDASREQAGIAIELAHADVELQQKQYGHFIQLKEMLHGSLGEEWLWQPAVPDEHGKTIGRIGKELHGVNVLRTEDWPALISFFKPRIIALDDFWSMARYGFEGLV